MLKYSRQRECIKQNILSRCDHPTAEMVYQDIRKEYPNISLGTVYRNLALLAELGEIQELPSPNGPDRFDGRTDMHSHFICRKCGRIMDLILPEQGSLNARAADVYPGLYEHNSVTFHGICIDCLNAEATNSKSAQADPLPKTET